jgi:hypothetical protein
VHKATDYVKDMNKEKLKSMASSLFQKSKSLWGGFTSPKQPAVSEPVQPEPPRVEEEDKKAEELP